MNTNSSVQVVKSFRYNFENLSSLLGDQPPKTQNNNHERNMLNELHGNKLSLLRRINDWKDCPASYRNRLHKRLQSIDVSQKVAISKLDDIIREIGILEFNLQLNPAWIRGLLKLVDEILDQTKREQRDELITEFSHLKEQFGLLKNSCNRYYMAN